MNLTEWIGEYGENEKPLDREAVNGGFCGILQKVACIGDSLSSGEFQSRDENGDYHFHDMYEYSWGQFMARMCGIKVYNFSKGGMTAKQYCESFAEENDFWNKDKASKAYIIALGVNDVLNQHSEIGTLDDICKEDYTKCKSTFLGYYGKIILRYKEIAPYAKFFIVTIPKHNKGLSEERNRLNDALRSLADFFDRTYIIDLQKYGPDYDEKFLDKFFLSGHMDASGYLLTAKMITSYIDYIIRHNREDFKQIGFVNTPYYNIDYKR